MSAKRPIFNQAETAPKKQACGFGKSVRKFPMLVGYARVSTTDQNLALQRDALKAAGCRKVFADHGVSGSIVKRPGLDAALVSLKPGDTLLVWKLDRLGRSLAHLVQTISDLGERGINFRSLSDPIDTESAGGRLVLHIMAALAEFERSLNSERTRAGLAAANRRGRKLGRRRSLTHAQLAHASKLLKKGQARSLIAEKLGVARSTLFLSLRRDEIELARLPRRRRK
jgi:DNA invertase Pin-like site-specific DNA recombinase